MTGSVCDCARVPSREDPARPGTAPALGAWAEADSKLSACPPVRLSACEVKSLVREVIGDACAQSSPSQRAGRNSTQKVHLLVTAVSHVFPRTFMEEGGCTSSWGLPLFVGRKTPAIPSFVSKYFGLPSEVASLVDPRLARPHTACAGVRVAAWISDLGVSLCKRGGGERDQRHHLCFLCRKSSLASWPRCFMIRTRRATAAR